MSDPDATDRAAGTTAKTQRLFQLSCLTLVLVIAAVLRMQRLTEVSYWFDESFTLKMAEFPFVDLLQRNVHDDDNPPLYYLILRCWNLTWGPSLVAPRLLSVICGLVAVAGTYFFVIEASKLPRAAGSASSEKFAGLLAALLVALSPGHVSWSSQVRMYSMAPALAVISAAFLARALRTGSPWTWLLTTVFSALQLYNHYFGLFLVGAQYLFAFLYLALWNRGALSSAPPAAMNRVLLSILGVYLLFLPWQIPFLEHRSRVADKFPAPPLTWEAAGSMLCRIFDLQLAMPVTPLVGLGVAHVWLIAVAALLIKRRPMDVLLVLLAALPFAATFAVSLWMRNVLVQRYLLGAQLFVLVSIAVAINLLPGKWLRWGLAACAVLGMGALAREQYLLREFDATLPGMRGAVAYLDQHRSAEEPVIVVNPMLFTSIVAYTQQRSGIQTYGTRQSYPFYQGTAVMRDDEFLSQEAMEDVKSRRLWTFDADQWFGGTWNVRVPSGWKEVGRSRFPEFNAEFVVRCYERTK